MKRSLLICVGESGSGKTSFINKHLLTENLFHNLRSFTTRAKRPDEKENDKYFFVDETTFQSQELVTNFWVNKDFWTPGKPKWQYGVPEFEIENNLGKNLVYDVIEPRYARELVEWFKKNKLCGDYDIKLAWFIPPIDNHIADERANMPDDVAVRKTNTCTIYDILNAGFRPNFILCPRSEKIDSELLSYIGLLYNDFILMRELAEKDRNRPER